MSVWRTCFAADKTGFHLLHTLFQTSLKYDKIARLDECFVTSLLVEDGRCVGVSAMNQRTGAIHPIAAKSVILTTGGNGRIYAFTTNGNICTGDGMALAYRAGVPLKDMEMVQFHPTGLPATGILITEAVRGEGGYLINNKGERFLKDYVPSKMELGPRDIISRAEVTEFEKGNGFKGEYGDYMHLDVRHLGEEHIDLNVGVFRTAEGLAEQEATVHKLRQRYKKVHLDDHSKVFNTELTAALELDFMLELAEVMTHCAAARKESRGAHARRDFPDRDDEKFLANTIATRGAPGEPPTIEYRPVRITDWQPAVRSY